MKNVLNSPESAVEDLITGLVTRNRDLARVTGWPVVVRRTPSDARVKVISGGGSGHEPAHAGYVGAGMLDAAVCGPVFTSPSVDAVLAAIRAVAPDGEDVVLVVKSYTGDRLNFGLAARQARAEGHRVRTVLVADDVALGAGEGAGRRGLAGTVLVHKVIGAVVARGGSMDEAADAAEELLGSLGTMGVSLGPCHVPGAGDGSFEAASDHVEWGLGIHGEPGVEQGPLGTAAQAARRLVDTVVADRDLQDQDVAVLVNGLGGLSALELEVLTGGVLSAVREHGLRVALHWTGDLLTSLDMPGASVTVAAVTPELTGLLTAETTATAWVRPTVPAEEPAEVEVGSTDPLDSQGTGDHEGEGVPEGLHRAVLRAAETLIDHEDELTAADRVVGDGDLGVNLSRGARAVLDSAERLEALGAPDAYFTALSFVLRHHVGGTSGPLYAVLTMGLAQGCRETAGGTEGSELLESLVRGFSTGVQDMCHLGGAQEGDSTMMDALVPAERAARAALAPEDSGPTGTAHRPPRSADVVAEEVAHAVVGAARDGAASTAEVVASKGRSSYVGERSRGVQDPGAQAVVLWLDAALEPWLGQRPWAAE